MEIIQNLTNEGLHDWFKDPKDAGWEELPELSMHRQMLGLMRTQFLPNLVTNSMPPSEEEAGAAGGAHGITYMALRLVAFWLSWVRHRCVQEFGAMLLSQKLLDAIKAWGGPNAPEPEVELRDKLHEDFSRFGVAENEGPWGIGVTCTGECFAGVKERGNVAFKAGRNLMAVSHYSMAMDLNPGEAALYANRSAALLKWATTNQIEERERQHHLNQVIADCEQAIELKADYTKAFYRKGQALVLLGEAKQACEALRVGFGACAGDDTLKKLFEETVAAMPEGDRPAPLEEKKEEVESDLLDVE